MITGFVVGLIVFGALALWRRKHPRITPHVLTPRERELMR